MKKIIFLVLLAPIMLFSQKKQDLYILYDDCSIHKISKTNTDTLDLETYQIRFRDKLNLRTTFSVSESGKLKKQIQFISGKSYPYLSIVYLNKNNDNPPQKINLSKITNKIWAKNIIYAIDTDFSMFLKKFKNFYLVDFNDKTSTIKIVKKVDVTFVPTL